jgi:hypothetical protein
MTVQRLFRGVRTRTTLRERGVPTLTTAHQHQLSVPRESSLPPPPILSPKAQNLLDARTVASRELRGDVRLLRLEGSRSVYCGRVAPINGAIVGFRAEMGRPLSRASSRGGHDEKDGEEGREEGAERRDKVAWVAPNGLGITDFPSNDPEVPSSSLSSSIYLFISLSLSPFSLLSLSLSLSLSLFLSPLYIYISPLCSSFSLSLSLLSLSPSFSPNKYRHKHFPRPSLHSRFQHLSSWQGRERYAGMMPRP